MTLFLVLVAENKNFSRSGMAPGHADWSIEERDHYKKERLYWIFSSLISSFALIAAAAGAYFALGAYQEAKRQASIAQQSLNSSTRPWALVEEVKANSHLAFHENNVSIYVKGIVKNYSQNPIISASFSAKLIQASPGISYPLQEAKSFCDEFHGTSAMFANVVPPGAAVDTLVLKTETKLDPRRYFVSPREGRQFFQLMLIGCLNYAGLDGKSYQTVSHYSLNDNTDGVFFVDAGHLFADERLEFMMRGMFANEKQQQ
jgi:hypothetical protein